MPIIKMLKIEYDKERIERNIKKREGYIETNPQKLKLIMGQLEILNRVRLYLLNLL